MVLIEIKVNTPQPLDCPKCENKYGYKVVERIQKYIDTIYDQDGNNSGCVYSEHKYKKTICSNAERLGRPTMFENG